MPLFNRDDLPPEVPLVATKSSKRSGVGQITDSMVLEKDKRTRK